MGFEKLNMFNLFKNKLVKNKTVIIYSSTSFFKAFTTMLVGFIVAKFISPEDLGLWTTLNIALAYSAFLQAGVINGLNLELPKFLGLGDLKKAYEYAGIAQTFTLILSVIVLVFGLGYFFLTKNIDPKYKFGILGITFLIITSFYQTYLLSTFRSNSTFNKLSYIQSVEALFNVLTVVLVVYFAYYGMVMKAILVLLFCTILLHIYRPIRAKLYWNKQHFFDLLKVGLPIFVLVILEAFALNIDKVWLVKFSSFNEVGLYSFGLYGMSMFILFSSSIASYIYPKMTFDYAQNGNKLILWNYVKKITTVLFAIQIPIVVIGYFLIPYIIPVLFPNYTAGIDVFQILLIAGACKGAVVGVNVLWSMKDWKFMYAYMILYFILLVGLTYLFCQLFTDKIIGVAYGVVLANLLNIASALYFAYTATHVKKMLSI